MEKILIVDDDVLVLKTIQNVLVRKKYETLCAKNSKEAFDFLEKEKVDLIISDIRMPGEDGLTFIGKVKDYLLRNGLEAPFLFITGYASEEAPIQAMELGASGYVLKPIDIDQFLDSINRALSRVRERKSKALKVNPREMLELIGQFKRNKADLIMTDEVVRAFIQDLESRI